MERYQIQRMTCRFLLPAALLFASCGGATQKSDLCQTVLWGERAGDADKAKIVTTAPADRKRPAHTVMGIVTDPDGNQLSGATVQLTSANNKLALTDTTNIAGRFVFTDSRLKGTVSLRIDKQGYRCFQLGDMPVDGSTEATIRVLADDNN